MLKENNIQVFMIWSIILFLIAISAVGYNGNADDAYWHIKVGEWIFTHRQVPTTGIFSYSNADKPWVSHEWLSALVFYKVFQFGGWASLFFLALLSLFCTFQILLWFLLKRLSVVQSLIFILFAYLLIILHILPRPHILAMPIMTYWTACLIETSEKQSKPPFYLLLLMILWVNLHGSFIIGIVFAVFFAAEAIFYAASDNRKQLAQHWFVFIIGSIVCAAITPHGIDGLLLPFQLSSQNYTLSRISEWQSPNFHGFQPLELWLLSFLALILFQGIKLPIFRLLFLLGLLHLSLKHIRHACDLLSVLSPLILATPLAKHWNSQPEMRFEQLGFKNYSLLVFLMLYCYGLFFYLSHVKIIELPRNQKVQQVLQILKPDKKNLGNVLNNYETGDFLIYLDYQTFIDPRAEIYGDEFIKNYFDAIDLIESSKKMEDIIAKYKIRWTIFYTHEPINTYLATQPQWHRIYSDKDITVFIHQAVTLNPYVLTQIKTLEKLALAEQKEKEALEKK